MNKSPIEIIQEIKQTMSPVKTRRKNKNKEEIKNNAKQESKYKHCYEAIQEFSNEYNGIRKFATVGELQLRLTDRIGRCDDMRGCTKQEQDKQLRGL